MKVSVSIEIERSLEEVWEVIVDFENCSNYITGINDLEIIDQPKDTLVGFKWKETRVVFGKSATETMWITDYAENTFYQTRAESHGSIYMSKLAVQSIGQNTRLTMSFSSEAKSIGAKLSAVIFSFAMKGSMKKLMMADITDIKTYLESN